MISVGIIGASGYTGEELVKILQNHPNVEIKSLTSRTSVGIVLPIPTKPVVLINKSFSRVPPPNPKPVD